VSRDTPKLVETAIAHLKPEPNTGSVAKQWACVSVDYYAIIDSIEVSTKYIEVHMHPDSDIKSLIYLAWRLPLS